METALTLLLLATGAHGLASPSAAGEMRLPAKLLGQWCQAGFSHNDVSTYNRIQARAKCHTSWMQLRSDGMDGQDGTDGPSEECKLLQLITIKKDRDYIAKFGCKLYGQGPREPWTYRLSLEGEQLILTAFGEKQQ